MVVIIIMNVIIWRLLVTFTWGHSVAVFCRRPTAGRATVNTIFGRDTAHGNGLRQPKSDLIRSGKAGIGYPGCCYGYGPVFLIVMPAAFAAVRQSFHVNRTGRSPQPAACRPREIPFTLANNAITVSITGRRTPQLLLGGKRAHSADAASYHPKRGDSCPRHSAQETKTALPPSFFVTQWRARCNKTDKLEEED